MTYLQRIKILLKTLESLGVVTSQADAGRKLGYTNPSSFSQVVNGSVSVPKNFTERVVRAFPEVNYNWLLTGDGEMLATTSPPSNSGARDVPVINLDGIGNSTRFNEITDTDECFIGVIPFTAEIARDGDFFMYVCGDSMSPKYPAGCLVLLREIELWREYLELGVTYTLLLRDGRRVIKELREGSDRDHVVLWSVNPSYDPVEISRSFIARVFVVVLSIRKEVL